MTASVLKRAVQYVRRLHGLQDQILTGSAPKWGQASPKHKCWGKKTPYMYVSDRWGSEQRSKGRAVQSRVRSLSCLLWPSLNNRKWWARGGENTRLFWAEGYLLHLYIFENCKCTHFFCLIASGNKNNENVHVRAGECICLFAYLSACWAICTVMYACA